MVVSRPANTCSSQPLGCQHRQILCGGAISGLSKRVGVPSAKQDDFGSVVPPVAPEISYKSTARYPLLFLPSFSPQHQQKTQLIFLPLTHQQVLCRSPITIVGRGHQHRHHVFQPFEFVRLAPSFTPLPSRASTLQPDGEHHVLWYWRECRIEPLHASPPSGFMFTFPRHPFR